MSIVINSPIQPETDKSFNENNREFRLVGSPYFTKKALEYMRNEKIRKRTDLVSKAIKLLVGID